MKRIITLFLLVSATISYGQTVIKNMEGVKYNYVTDKPFELYDPKKKNLEHLKYFKATDPKTSIIVFHGIASSDSIQLVSGGKTIKEGKFEGYNSPGIRSISTISNQKNLEIIFYKQTTIEKITLSSEDLKKYKYIYVSRRKLPIEIEFINFWKQFY